MPRASAGRGGRGSADAAQRRFLPSTATQGTGGVDFDVSGATGRRRAKYGNVATYVDGIRFASKREAERYQALTLLVRAGEIRALELQPRYPLVVNGVKVATYVADFVYADADTGALVVEDVKGVRTREYVMKSRLLLALYGHHVREV